MIRPRALIGYMFVCAATPMIGITAAGAQEPTELEPTAAIIGPAEPGTEGPVEAPAGARAPSELPEADAVVIDASLAGEVDAVVAATDSTSSSGVLVAGALALGGIIAAVWAVQRGREAADPVESGDTDSVTGLFSRRRLDQDIDRRRQGGDGRVACLMMDIDHFARFDDHGRGVGDEVLRRVAAMIGEQIRGCDVAYRFGANEFCVLLPDTTDDEAYAVAERLRTHAITLELPVDATVTVSLGLASGVGDEVSDVVRTADAALVVARTDGRNRTVIG